MKVKYHLPKLQTIFCRRPWSSQKDKQNEFCYSTSFSYAAMAKHKNLNKDYEIKLPKFT